LLRIADILSDAPLVWRLNQMTSLFECGLSSPRGIFASQEHADLQVALRLLDPRGWLSSTAMDVVGILLERRYTSAARGVFIVPSYYWQGHRVITRQTPLQFAPRRFVACPINLGEQHWALLVADARTGTLSFYNSFRGAWAEAVASERVLVPRLDELRRSVLARTHPTVAWSMVVRDVPLPRQRDGWSCGLYVLRTIECLASGADAALVEHSWDSQSDALRLHFLDAVVLGAIMAPFDDDHSGPNNSSDSDDDSNEIL
jgi:Ulp1 family protease